LYCRSTVEQRANGAADTPPYLGIAYKDLSRDAFSIAKQMNPDKLFDYLEGRLPAAERAALEQQLI